MADGQRVAAYVLRGALLDRGIEEGRAGPACSRPVARGCGPYGSRPAGRRAARSPCDWRNPHAAADPAGALRPRHGESAYVDSILLEHAQAMARSRQPCQDPLFCQRQAAQTGDSPDGFCRTHTDHVTRESLASANSIGENDKAALHWTACRGVGNVGSFHFSLWDSCYCAAAHRPPPKICRICPRSALKSSL